MAKIMIVYESKWGNTKTVAETIAEGARDSGGEPTLSELKAVDLNQLAAYDAVVVGSPNHVGNATRGIRKFIGNLGNLKSGKYAVFDTCFSGDFEKAVKKMEKVMRDKAPGLEQAAPGLSVIVTGMKGPIAEGELPKCKEFGAAIAASVISSED
jgi:menaquinone-dependent protoporphyrinogen IX oxidase